MTTGIHTALARVNAGFLRKGAVEHVVSRLHILVLLINLYVALALIILS